MQYTYHKSYNSLSRFQRPGHKAKTCTPHQICLICCLINHHNQHAIASEGRGTYNQVTPPPLLDNSKLTNLCPTTNVIPVLSTPTTIIYKSAWGGVEGLGGDAARCIPLYGLHHPVLRLGSIWFAFANEWPSTEMVHLWLWCISTSLEWGIYSVISWSILHCVNWLVQSKKTPLFSCDILLLYTFREYSDTLSSKILIFNHSTLCLYHPTL